MREQRSPDIAVFSKIQRTYQIETHTEVFTYAELDLVRAVCACTDSPTPFVALVNLNLHHFVW